jgi:predicted peptidase
MELVKNLPTGNWPGLARRYLVYLPQRYEWSDAVWPVILFLHGAGERGDGPEVVRQQGLAKRLAGGADLPFIVVAPQCLAEESWQPETLGLLLDLIETDYRVDSNRVYLTGMSMGGRGTWTLASAYPKRFAAIAPVCGRGEPAEAEKVAHLPVWAFHGALDPLVPLERSQEMIAAVQACGGEARLTVYEDAEHDSWTQAYAEPELYSWLLSKRRA